MSTPLSAIPSPPAGLLDNTQIASAVQGRYIAHAAVGCNNVSEAALWYAQVLGAQPVRILEDRVTFSVGGVLQLVCHLEKRTIARNPRAYPQHFGLTFLCRDDFNNLAAHIGNLGIKTLAGPTLRFPKTDHEHQTLMLADPSGNVVEFKCYLRPDCSY